MNRAQWFLIPLMAAAAVAPAPAAASWTDRGEYDLVLQLRAEAVPEKRLALLDEWKRKYPKSELRQVRRELLLGAYQMNGDGPRMLEVAREMVADQPKGFVGLFWVTTLVPGIKDPKPDVLEAGEKAARQLLEGLKGYFTPPPANVTAADASRQRSEVELAAHRTLGWVQWRRRDYAAAEKEFAECLKVDPKDAQISSWYGTVLAEERKPEKQPAALWHLARAVSVQGDSGLSQSQRRDFDALLEQFYTAYHGNLDGIGELRGGAAASPLPPDGFTVESAGVVAARRQRDELVKAHPELVPWLEIRQKLEAADGDTYFATLKSNPLPRVKGTLIRFEPSLKPKRLVLGVLDAAKEEVVVDLDNAFANEAPPGTVLEFGGKPSSYTREPFRLTLDVSRDEVDGWPARKRK
jgi:hypothetical protein